MLLRERILSADLGRQSMDSNRVQEHGLRSLDNQLSYLWYWFCSLSSDHSVFARCTKCGSVILAMYVDILLTGSDSVALTETKKISQASFCNEGYWKAKIFSWD